MALQQEGLNQMLNLVLFNLIINKGKEKAQRSKITFI